MGTKPRVGKLRVGSGNGFGGPRGGSGGPGGGFVIVVKVKAEPLLTPLRRNHCQDHQNNHQDHQNHYQNHLGVAPLRVQSPPKEGCKDASSQCEQSATMPDQIELEIVTIAGERVTVLVCQEASLADIAHVVEKSAKFGVFDHWPRLVLGTEIFADVCSQPLLGIKDGLATLTLVKQQCSELSAPAKHSKNIAKHNKT